MDVHNLQGATAIQVEQHHAADLAEQGKYGVEYLKYWFKGVARGDSPAQGGLRLKTSPRSITTSWHR
jgi:hypothetical protein